MKEYQKKEAAEFSINAYTLCMGKNLSNATNLQSLWLLDDDTFGVKKYITESEKPAFDRVVHLLKHGGSEKDFIGAAEAARAAWAAARAAAGAAGAARAAAGAARAAAGAAWAAAGAGYIAHYKEKLLKLLEEAPTVYH